jgi:Spy/CpxP family protein refolding chaperone
MRTFILLIACMFAIVCTSAQEGRRLSPEETAQHLTEWMTTELKLTGEQQAPVDSINLLFARAQQILFQSANGDRDKIREAMTALNQEKEKALADVLTPEQLDDFKKKSAEMISNRRRQR